MHSFLEVFRPLLNHHLLHATPESSSFGNQYNRVEILRWLPSGWRRIDLPPGIRKKDNCIKFIRFEVELRAVILLLLLPNFCTKQQMPRKITTRRIFFPLLLLLLLLFLVAKSSSSFAKKTYRSVSPFLSAMLSCASSYLSVSGSLDVDWVDDIKELFHHGHFLVDKVDFAVHGLQHILIQLSRQFLDRYYISLLWSCSHNNEKSILLPRLMCAMGCWRRTGGFAEGKNSSNFHFHFFFRWAKY